MALLTIEALRQRVEILCLITGKPCLKIGEYSSLASTFSHPHMTPHIDPNALSRITNNGNFWFQMSQHYVSPQEAVQAISYSSSPLSSTTKARGRRLLPGESWTELLHICSGRQSGPAYLLSDCLCYRIFSWSVIWHISSQHPCRHA